MENNNLPNGWFFNGDIQKYRHLAESCPDNGIMIELGAWKGRSLCSIADIIKRKHLKVFVVDTFKGTENEGDAHKEASEINIRKEFESNIAKFGLDVKIFQMTTDVAAEIINDMFDLIFIDADHSEEAVLSDVKNWLPKCKGTIAGHDFERDSVRKAVTNLLPKVDFIVNGSEDNQCSIWWTNVNQLNTKKIDVIIPACNAQKTIARTIASIVMQSIHDDISVTIVNDADGIGYSEIVESFSKFIDIKEITLDVNGGPGVARQYGIDNSTSPYFTCIDADDTFASAFALETLYRSMKANPDYHTVVGSFIEQHENLQFLMHSNDLIWMFGKLYTRAFIEKYKIRFNETRANEDNGFNTIIRLVSSETEKIMFLPDVVYFWHHKEDSITRINNNQYSYDQSFVGYTDNMIYAIREAKKQKPFNSYIDMWAIQVMAQLFIYYFQTVKRDSRFKDQNYQYCVKYYKEVFKHFHDTLQRENFDAIFAETLSQQSQNMKDFVSELTIYQFIDKLKSEVN